jgi:hypothetical protein
MTIATELFDKMEIPEFSGLTTDEGWAACIAWEFWAYDNADDFSEDGWDNAVRIMRTNYDRYYQWYGED